MRRVFSIGVLVAVVLVSQVRSAEEGRDPEAVRQAYTAVASRLDQGGDLMIVANIDGLLERFMADLVEIASTASGGDAESKQAMETATKLHAFLKKSGFYAVNGVGMSSGPWRNERLMAMRSRLRPPVSISRAPRFPPVPRAGPMSFIPLAVRQPAPFLSMPCSGS
ncbi:MAG: hypothetical protein QGH42_05835 [Kiritimatiellia bacterium]|nr:hypothetical protein [Kiritimatiellia bacterium]MDP6810662.1 hypothetical protein [Kiritimatiellia bacterium]MDP7023748.1 hypothetical protein [Kiritimatiellia bacterium]